MVFRFLDLPSELRNRVYEIAAAAGDEPLVITRRPHREDGNYAGLTRTCVQIRAEYRPMQRRSAKLSVCFSDLEDFTQTFLTSAADTMILPLEVHVRVSRLTRPGYPLSFDSLPILEVKVANPCLDIRILPVNIPNWSRFMRNGPQDAAALATMALTQTQGLNSLLLHSNKNWHACISNGSIGEVYIEMETGFTRVEIVFMGRLGYRELSKIQRDDEDWRISHGLQAPTSHVHRFDFTFLHQK
ncbi:hypothetical protein J4E83_003618 [Alternaria metachromatica]|uniref:uncharacterized protein n=1 Tax=Alternaria metachromatica TaxID=283354 RepID=UPI0020C21E09|nr:uncharacterized protein J4E83_003618 [Alternaria metachromatica]KAI4626467.1 hypothetical protein J4E83_003618 [Alternaria metachromatica]